MILQALNDYYLRRQADPDPAHRLPAYGLEDKEIPFVVEIDVRGELVALHDTRMPNGKKKIGQRFLVPQGVKKTSGVAANLLWDTAEYVLGINTRGKPDRVREQHAAFRHRIDTLPEASRSDEGVRAVLAFLDGTGRQVLAAEPSWAEIQETNPLMTFRLHGDTGLVCQRPAIVAAATEPGANEEDSTACCLVTGQLGALERLHPAIKGVWDAQTSGANVVSFNLDAFNSYGKAQGANAPVSRQAAFAYTTALNALLARDSRQRVQVGDASTVFWAERQDEFENWFGEIVRDDPDTGAAAVAALLNAVQSGRYATPEGETRFFVLGLAPNAARIAVRFWTCATLRELAPRIAQHFEDICVARAPNDPEHLSLSGLLASGGVLTNDWRKSNCRYQGRPYVVQPRLAGEILRSVLEGTAYPMTLLNAVVIRARAEQRVSYARAAAIKGWLNREIRRSNRTTSVSEREFTDMLNHENPNAAYRLGRLFATLEKIQEEASPGLNATIRDRYYGAASATPAAVFATLLRLKNHHLPKLSGGRQVQMERMLGNILGGLADFPAHLGMADQGRFALGYYHQRQDFFTRKDANDNNPKEK